MEDNNTRSIIDKILKNMEKETELQIYRTSKRIQQKRR